MTAHTRIEQPLEATARAILRGTAVFCNENGPYDETDWRFAALSCRDGDDAELRFMLRRQAQYEVWHETKPRWDEPYGRGEIMPFADWIERIAERVRA